MNKVFDALGKYNRREQTILLVGALSIVLYILWMGVLAPLKDKREQQIATNASTSASLERVKLMAAQIKQAQSNTQKASGNSGANFSQLIDSTLQANGLRMSGFQPGTRGEVRVRLDNVNYASVMQWLYDLEYRHDVAVKDLSMAGTNTAGQVTANIRLSKN
ncbi:type II secretion system protein M [Gilvimarinus sp. SDUM040013]|uniref:Type II secretion system protein M n=1 Tax=Gilvimarinus gilvus TaxID=3058038 RepID=A0ABU4S2Z2_9GAMM|nr:type II secretion system protein M [Gilvimarinus sp. SDUM040013]MDO3388729.1 type II secretion system protein M [Gilvimarinus sp. SDUM040013]MDX6849624.1 type II secretion system protein M [Gilvimarinus sp. SDUM040013]